MERNALIVIVALAAVAVVLGAALGAVVLMQPAGTQVPKQANITLWWPIAHYGDTEPDIAAILESNIEATGRVNVELQSAEWATYIDQFVAGEMGIFLLGWFPDFADSDNFIQPFLSTEGAESLGSFYSDPLMDLAILQQRTSFGDERAEIFAEIQAKLAKDAMYIPLFQGNQHVVYQDDVTGVTLEPVRSFRYTQIEKPDATTLRIGTTDQLTTLDTADAYNYFSVQIADHVFETLLDYEPGTTNLIPGLAVEVPTVANGLVSPDGLEYTYNIRPGVTFHDGTSLDAAAVKFSLDRARDLGGDPGFLLNVIDSVEVVDSDTVKVTLTNPFTPFNTLMAFSVSAIVSPTAYTANEFRNGLSDDALPIGTGPYMLEAGGYQADQRITLTQNPDYWGTAGVHSEIQVTLASTATALKQIIETGDVHVVFRTLNPDDLLDLQDRQDALGLQVEIGVSPFIRYIVFNVESPPFDNAWMRRTIAAAVDRDAIVDQVFQGTVFPLYSMIPDSFPFHTDAFMDEYGVGPDLDLANEYLDNYFASIEGALGQDLFADLILPPREAA